MPLRRFWIEFSDLPATAPTILRAGCGVTAADESEGIALVRTNVFGDSELPPIRSVIHDIDVSTLDPRHVRPNMGNPAARGVWFPLGYARS